MKQQIELGGNVYDTPPSPEGWLDFSANINPLGLSAAVRNTLECHLDKVMQYPDPQGKALKRAISQHYHLPETALILGNGAAELFYLYMHTRRPRRVVIPVPSFSEYERASLAVGAAVDYVFLPPDKGFSLCLSQLHPYCQQTDCIILGNPNNPTGTLTLAEELEQLIQIAAQTQTDVVIDESFLDFLPDDRNYTVNNLVKTYANLWCIRSLTKFYALPGLRLGFAAVPEVQQLHVERQKDCWNVNILAQYAGIAALEDAAYQERSRRYIDQAGKLLYHALQSIPELDAYPPSVNFILVRSKRPDMPAWQIGERLRKQGILIRDCANYPGLDTSYFRLAVRNIEDNQRICRALRAMLQK